MTSVIPCLAFILLATFLTPKDDAYEISDPNLFRAIEADLDRSYQIKFIHGALEKDFKKETATNDAALQLFKYTLSLDLSELEKKTLLNNSMQAFFIQIEHKVRENYASLVEKFFSLEPGAWYLSNLADLQRSPCQIAHDLTHRTSSGKVAFSGWTIDKEGEQKRLFEIDVTGSLDWSTKTMILKSSHFVLLHP